MYSYLIKLVISVSLIVSGIAAASDSYAISKLTMSKLNIKQASSKNVSNQNSFMILVSDKNVKPSTKAGASSSRTLVLIDGILFDLDRGILQANIRNGFFKVVWAGSAQDKITLCWLNPENCELGDIDFNIPPLH